MKLLYTVYIYHQSLQIQTFLSHVSPIIAIPFLILLSSPEYTFGFGSILVSKLNRFRISLIFVYLLSFVLNCIIIHNFSAKHCQAGVWPSFPMLSFIYFLKNIYYM